MDTPAADHLNLRNDEGEPVSSGVRLNEKRYLISHRRRGPLNSQYRRTEKGTNQTEVKNAAHIFVHRSHSSMGSS